MKKVMKIVSMILTLAIIIGLVACGSGSSNNATTASTASAVTTAGSESATANTQEDLLGKYPEPITINMIGLTYDDLENQLSAVNETFEDNRWTKLIKDRLNIDIKYTFVAKDPVYTTKVGVLLASGDLPDIFQTQNTSQFKQLLDNDMIADLTDSYNKYMGQDYKATVAQDPYMQVSNTIAGKIMAISPSCSLTYSTMAVLWLRYDWMQKLGLSEPKNMDDLYNIAKAFVESDPDGVPVTAGYGLPFYSNMFGNSFDLFVNAYHAYNQKWIVKNGKLEYGSIQPEMKTALEALAKWYKAGLIDKEFITKDVAKVNDEFTSGKIGIIGEMDYQPLFLTSFPDKHPDGDLRAYPMVSADNVPCSPQSEVDPAGGGYVVRKGFEHPEALMKMTNLITAIMYGDEGKAAAPDGTTNNVYYNAPKEASSLYLVEPLRFNLVLDVNLYRYKIGEAVISKDTSEVTPGDMFIYDNMLAYLNGDKSQWGWYKSFCTDYGGAFAVKHYKDNNLGFVNAFYGLPINMDDNQTTADKGILIQTKLYESFTKIIMGSVDISEFDNCIKNFNAMGGIEMTEQVNKWYELNKSK